MSDDIAIKVEHLTKVYHLYDSPRDRFKEALHPFRKKFHHDFYAVNDVSFEIKRGETVGIIGQNGSGKSTLLKMITGVLSPTSGSIHVNGRISSLLELGTGFNPDMTGLENIYFYGTINGMTHEQISARVDDIISFADIGEFIHQPVKTYSSGMFVRLAFSAAVHIEPDILIVDEALSVGDMRFTQKSFRKMQSFIEEGKTLLLVSHDLGSIQNMSNNVLWMHDGKVRDNGIPKDVIKRYMSFMAYGQETQIEEPLPENPPAEIVNRQDVEGAELPFKIDPSAWISTEGMESFGDGGAKIERVAFVDGRGKPVASVRPGEEIIVLAQIDNTIISNQLGLGILFKDRLGQAIFTINTYMYGFRHFKHLGEGKTEKGFRFTWPEINDGSYSMTLAISDGTQAIHTQLHWVHDILEINSLSGELYSRMGTVVFISPYKVQSL